jgi:protein tyrosine phosphatase
LTLGQLILKSRLGQKLYAWQDLVPFKETAVTIQKWRPDDSSFINANYIKTSFQEESPHQDPFGLIIATQGP